MIPIIVPLWLIIERADLMDDCEHPVIKCHKCHRFLEGDPDKPSNRQPLKPIIVNQEPDYYILHDMLIDGFINYQWGLDHPMPTTEETRDTITRHYHLCDPIFHAKVNCLAAGVTDIVRKWLEEQNNESA